MLLLLTYLHYRLLPIIEIKDIGNIAYINTEKSKIVWDRKSQDIDVKKPLLIIKTTAFRF